VSRTRKIYALSLLKNNKMESISSQRLLAERKAWRRDHPFGFYARVRKTSNALDLRTWDCGMLCCLSVIRYPVLFMARYAAIAYG
jgi:hypothetical protein